MGVDKIINVAACIITDEEESNILLLRRNDPIYQGHWAFPGGKVELGEHVIDAAKRELEEETGIIDIKRIESQGVLSELLTQDDKLYHFIIHLFMVSTPFKESMGSDEGEVRWFSIEELRYADQEDKFVPSDLRIIRELFGGSYCHCRSCIISKNENGYSIDNWTLVA